MRYRHTIKPFLEFETDDGVKFAVRYDYDPGEEQWFDARAGVGSPGHPASVEVTEVSFGENERDWGPPQNFSQVDVARIGEQIMEMIDTEANDFFAAYAEHMEES